MSVTIADLLEFQSFQNAEIRAGRKNTGRYVSGFSSEAKQMEAGLFYALDQRYLDISAFIEGHPEASGFLIPKTASFHGRGPQPVIAVEDVSACLEEWHSHSKTIQLSTELFELMQECRRDYAAMLEKAKEKLGMELYVVKEPDTIVSGSEKLTKKDCRELLNGSTASRKPVLLDGEECQLLTRGQEALDRYALCACAHALTAMAAVNSHVITASRQGIARLIYEGEIDIAHMAADACGIRLPKEASVWLLYGRQKGNARPWIATIREFCRSFGDVYLLESIGNDLILVLEQNPSYRLYQHHAESLSEYCQRHDMPLTLLSGLTLTGYYASLHQVRDRAAELRDEIRAVFPQKTWLSLQDFRFVNHCVDTLIKGGYSLIHNQKLIDRLLADGDMEILETLAVYYIDENMSVADTASRLFLHRNTVKYRLQKAEDILGINLSSALGIEELVEALAIARIAGQKVSMNKK